MKIKIELPQSELDDMGHDEVSLITYIDNLINTSELGNLNHTIFIDVEEAEE